MNLKNSSVPVLLVVLLSSSWTRRSYCFTHGFSSSRTKGSKFLRKHPFSNNGVFFKSENLVLTSTRRTPPGPAAGSIDAQTIVHQKRSYSELFAKEDEIEEDLEKENSEFSPAASDLSYFSRTTFTGEEEQEDACCEDTEFDMIVIGSGNGACGFLSHCLKCVKPGYKVLVLEEGQNFFYTSDVTHQNNWSEIYGTGRIYKLHNARTSDGRPIITGRARTMGGGGSINYTMIHESSKWLSENIGHSIMYWDKLKLSLNKKFCRPDPFKTQTKFSQHIQVKAMNAGFTFDPRVPHEPNRKNHYIGNIPSLQDNFDDYPTKEAKQFYTFPSQFNAYGQRTNSGVSIVDWDKVHLRCNRLVKELVMEGKSCTQVKVKNDLTKKIEVYTLKKHGKVILAAGSQSPRLLMRTPEIENKYIGKRVNDHICLPLGIYVVSKDLKATVGGADAYEPVFGSTVVDTSSFVQGDASVKEVVFLDFFTGSLERLSFLVSSLYLCYVPFNSLKRLFGRFPLLFTFLSNSIRILLTALVFVVNVLTFKFLNESNELKLTTSLIKFNAVREGHYEKENDQITLKFFEDENDFVIAEKAIKENLAFLESIGSRPNFLFRKLFQLLTKIPYDKDEVKRYVKHFSKRTLLSEQHLAGGCVFGEAIDDTGKVFDTDNIHVADLSAVPLPRCSTQMTAYLVGYHVAKQMFPYRLR